MCMAITSVERRQWQGRNTITGSPDEVENLHDLQAYKRRCVVLNSARARKYDTIAAPIGCAKELLKSPRIVMARGEMTIAGELHGQAAPARIPVAGYPGHHAVPCCRPSTRDR